MLKTIIVLPDGAEISSGTGTVNALQAVTLTECVNSGEELTPGSACANALEATLFTPGGGLTIEAGSEVTVYKQNTADDRTRIGIFVLEKPTKPTANTMKLTGYDRVSKLDKDLTAWLNSLTGWPYDIHTFASMICGQCGLVYREKATPNSDFQVYQFTRSSVTGRQLMQWLGEICCRFCRATADGEIEFAWYTPASKSITTSGELYYFQNGLTFEDYSVLPVDAVQIRLADSDNGALWPAIDDTPNSYIISGNAVLNARITDELSPVLESIKTELTAVRYKPCKVLVPANLDIRAGNIVEITDQNGVRITSYVMTKTQSGQKDTLECTGSLRRDSSSAVNNPSQSTAAQSAAQNAFAGMTPEQVLNKLTDNGKIQGLYQQDGKWYINAELAQVVNLIADNIVAGILKSVNGLSYFDLDSGEFSATDGSGRTVKMKTGQVYVERPDGGTGVALQRVADGGYAVMLYDNTGDHKGGLQSNSDGLWFWGISQDDGIVHGRKIGFKAITYVDVSGIPHTVDVLCSY